MKIYTKTGDKGETGLIGGKRVSKGDDRIISYGSIDELNSHIGLINSSLIRKYPRMFADVINVLDRVQIDLFIGGSDLADSTPPGENKYNTPRVDINMISYLESKIDLFEIELPTISFFILPGGSNESSLLHIARSVTRRAEIAVTILSRTQPINSLVLVYLNRLSDLLFVVARLVNKRCGVEDIPWRPTKYS